MTLAAFIAACVWPIFFVLAVLQKTVRDPVLSRSIGLVTVAFVMFCVVMMVSFRESSIVAVFDVYFLVVVLGTALVWRGFAETSYFVTGWKAKLRAGGMVIAGGALVFFPLSMFFQDLFLSPLVLEGRVRNPHVEGRRGVRYIAEISGRTMHVTTPVYERLKLLPVVRVEVGRGSNYVYEIEYLTN